MNKYTFWIRPDYEAYIPYFEVEVEAYSYKEAVPKAEALAKDRLGDIEYRRDVIKVKEGPEKDKPLKTVRPSHKPYSDIR